MQPGPILVLNAGSSSIRAAVFAPNGAEIARAEEMGIDTGKPGSADSHDVALGRVLAALGEQGTGPGDYAAAGHRIVHGGARLTASALITPAIRDEIAACAPLAPLHNPHHLAAIEALGRIAPDLPQVGVFDTAFHATIPDVARRYAIPDTPQTEGLIRYGFHGISYASLTRRLPGLTDAPLPARLLALHLGNGASLCAIRDGRSIATTMGYSPLGGLTMGTRSGDMDPGAVLALAARMGPAEADAFLNAQSGLLGLSGLSADMRTLLASDAETARFALQHFTYWIARHAGSMIAAMGGIDAIAFTGGIGENARDIRNDILSSLAWAGEVPAHVVPAEEEAFIAREAATVIEGGGADGPQTA